MKLRSTAVLVLLALCVLILEVSEVHAFPKTPNPELTPGHLCTEDNPDFFEFRYEENIPYCQRDVSQFRRRRVYERYNIPHRCRHRYTIDHFIPLSIGGSNRYKNLWPEHERLKSLHPLLEQEVFDSLNNGEITQQQAIDIIIDAKTTIYEDLSENVKNNECDIPTPHVQKTQGAMKDAWTLSMILFPSFNKE